MLRRFAITTLIITCTTACGGIASDDTGTGTAMQPSHSWNSSRGKPGTYHWPGNNRSPEYADLTTPGKYAVQGAVDDWNGLNAGIELLGPAATDEVEIVQGGDANSGWLGLAQIWTYVGGTHIARGRVTMNSTLLDDPNYSYLLNAGQHVLCQEIGHILGLDHNHDDLDTCMNDCTTATTRAEWDACIDHPEGTTTNAHDAQELALIYGHDDGFGDSEPDAGSGGGDDDFCTKHPNHRRCTSQGGWVTVHVFPAK